MSEEKKLIPELRFPEFKNDEEWIEVTYGDIGDFIGGGTPDTTKSKYWNGKIKWYTPAEIKEGRVGESKRTITEDGLKNSSAKLLPKGALLLTTRATIGDIAIAKFECATNQGFQSLVVNPTEVNAFWYYWIIRHKYELLKKASGSTFPEIGKNELVQIKALKPQRKEQQKIALCLSSLDEVISAHNQKLELLKEHKKGLMQNLFPKEGEKVPKFRFKEFEKDREWIEEKLGRLGEFLGGGTPSKLNSGYWQGDIPWISSSDINEDDIHNISISKYINEKAINESATKIIPVESILFVSRVGVGKLAINKMELCTSQDFINFNPKDVLNYFIAYYFLANKNLLQQLSQGTSIKGFSKNDLEEFKILLPKNSNEQQKIASCISYLDALINAQEEKLKQLKTHKKGLMQGLFPKIKE